MRRSRAAVALFVSAVLAGCAATPPATSTPVSPLATLAPTLTPTPSPAPTPVVPTPGPTLPSAAPTPSASPSPPRRPTRVEVPALGIDLPVSPPPKNPNAWPLCDVAGYFKPPLFQYPGGGGVTYIYAHAQAGMFLPILEASRVDGGQALKGQTVRVWTADNVLYTYQVRRFWRHQDSLDWVLELPPGSLILQTSEGPPPGFTGHTGLVVMIEARQVGPPVAATRAEAIPSARPRNCPP